jgi:DNA replication and repair protein RecF
VRLNRLELSYFRNLSSVSIDLAPGLNIFHGDNGAGKTALLEAVHLLCRGRSFRTQKAQSLIQHGAEQLVVRGILEDEMRGTTTLAISKDRQSRTELKVNGRSERRLSEVARMTPLQVMLPDIADLVFGGPANRRSWLDWGTFHVKPEYLGRLRNYLRAVKQRNALMRDGAPQPELAPWNEEVATLGLAVNEDRKDYLTEFIPQFQKVLAKLAPELVIDVSYHQGWPKEETLEKLLGETSLREVKYGSTLWGPHRADVRLRQGGSPVAGVLSRGQGKMVASALQIGQASLLAERDSRSTVFLIDDAGAELDIAHNVRFFGLLERIGGQILATTTRLPDSDDSMVRVLDRPGRSGRTEPDNAAATQVFHVEHGAVRSEEAPPTRD